MATLSSGQRLEIRINEGLDSSVAKAGQRFDATLDKDLVVDGKIVIARGGTVTGKVVEAVGAGKVRGRARLSITLASLEAGGTEYALKTNDLAFEAEGSEKSDAVKVGGGAGLGAVIGAIAGGGKGAAIGAAIGGATGGAVVLATKGKEVKFNPEERFSFVLREDLQVKLR